VFFNLKIKIDMTYCLKRFHQIIFILSIVIYAGFFLMPAETFGQSNRGDMPLQNFLSQSNTPLRKKWQRPAPTTLTHKISDDPSYKAMLDAMRAKEKGESRAQGTYDYWEQFDENYHSWDFCPYLDSRIGEYLEPEEVADRCCVCNNGWQCQFESRNVSEGDEYRQCLSPDIALQNFLVTSTETIPGTYQSAFTLDAKNIGSGDSQDFEVAIFLDETELGRENFFGLDVQQSTTLTQADFGITNTSLEFPSGDYVFRAEASLIDDLNTVGGSTSEIFEETDITNNTIEQTLNISAPDLAVTDLILTPQNDVIGQTQKHFMAVTIQNLGSHLAQATEIKLTQVDGAGNETVLLTETKTIFSDPTITSEIIDLELHIPFGTYLLRAEITPQQYDEDISNNIYEETVSATMPSFTDVALDTINNLIFEDEPRRINREEIIDIVEKETDTILTQVKTNLLADVNVEWIAIDSKQNKFKPFKIENYTTSAGHGALFKFSDPSTYTINATFTDIYNSNNFGTFEILTTTVQIPTPKKPEPPLPPITPITPTINVESGIFTRDGFTTNFSKDDTITIPAGGMSMQDFQFIIKHPYGDTAQIIPIMTPYIFMSSTPLNDSSGHVVSFITTNLSNAQLTLSGTINDNNGNSIDIPNFNFSVERPNDLIETYSTKKIAGTPIVSASSYKKNNSLSQKAEFCLHTTGTDNVYMDWDLQHNGQTITPSTIKSYDSQYGFCAEYSNADLPVGNYVFNVRATDKNDVTNYFDLMPISFSITAPTPTISMGAFKNQNQRFFDGDALTIGETIDIYVNSDYQEAVNMNWYIEDGNGDVSQSDYIIDNIYTQYGYKVTITPSKPGNYLVFATVISQENENNYQSSDDFTFTVNP
jgi:hypothetical protein